jgi:hypothetical protein
MIRRLLSGPGGYLGEVLFEGTMEIPQDEEDALHSYKQAKPCESFISLSTSAAGAPRRMPILQLHSWLVVSPPAMVLRCACACIAWCFALVNSGHSSRSRLDGVPGPPDRAPGASRPTALKLTLRTYLRASSVLLLAVRPLQPLTWECSVLISARSTSRCLQFSQPRLGLPMNPTRRFGSCWR